ncbi:hypothetical protein Tco_1544253 [Tanacetum coccineum]
MIQVVVSQKVGDASVVDRVVVLNNIIKMKIDRLVVLMNPIKIIELEDYKQVHDPLTSVLVVVSQKVGDASVVKIIELED